MQSRVAVIGERQGLARGEADEASHARDPWIEPRDMEARAERA
jgi:hypothetical protein